MSDDSTTPCEAENPLDHIGDEVPDPFVPASDVDEDQEVAADGS